MEQKPSIGRVVHFSGVGKEGPQTTAAMITYVPEGVPNNPAAVDLTIFGRNGIVFESCVPFSESPQLGHWNWPPRV